MSKASNANDEFDKEDTTTDDIPQGGDTVDNSYASKRGEDGGVVPVLKDETPVEQPGGDPDSDEMLRKSSPANLEPSRNGSKLKNQS
jgi:hypothetical protein